METTKPKDGNVEIEKLRFGSILMLFSVFVLVEGMVRFILSDPEQDSDRLDGDYNGQEFFPPIVMIIAATGEVFFGAMGLFVGVGQCYFGLEMPALTKVALGTMALFGWFVFLVYALAAPIYNLDNDIFQPHPVGGLNEDEYNTAVVFGHIFASISYCGCMQGMQFFSCLYLLNLQTGNHETTNDRNKMRVMWYGFLAFLGGFGHLVLGCLVADQEGEGELDQNNQYVFPPNFVYYPAMTILSGLVLMIYACLVLSTIAMPANAKFVKMFAIFTWLYLCIFHIMAQLTGFGPSLAFVSAMLIVLSTSLVIGPALFACWQEKPPYTVSS